MSNCFQFFFLVECSPSGRLLVVACRLERRRITNAKRSGRKLIFHLLPVARFKPERRITTRWLSTVCDFLVCAVFSAKWWHKSHHRVHFRGGERLFNFTRFPFPICNTFVPASVAHEIRQFFRLFPPTASMIADSRMLFDVLIELLFCCINFPCWWCFFLHPTRASSSPPLSEWKSNCEFNYTVRLTSSWAREHVINEIWMNFFFSSIGIWLHFNYVFTHCDCERLIER